MSDLLKILVGILVVALVAVTLVAFALNATMDTDVLLFIVLSVVILLGALFIVYQRARNYKRRLPVEDELAKKVSYKAGYFAFIAAVWICVGVIWLDVVLQEELGQAGLTLTQGLGTVILLSGLCFILSYLYLNTKGDA